MEKIMKLSKDLRFEELAKALVRIGYAQSQPRGGSSHYIFRKKGRQPISLPKATPMKRAYIELVAAAIKEAAIKENESEV